MTVVLCDVVISQILEKTVYSQDIPLWFPTSSVTNMCDARMIVEADKLPPSCTAYNNRAMFVASVLSAWPAFNTENAFVCVYYLISS